MKNKVIVKSNNLVEARYDLTGLEQKLLLISISELRDCEKNYIECSTKDLYEMLNIKTNRQHELRVILEELVNKKLIIIDKSSGKKGGTLVTHWFSSVKYQDDGKIRISFDTELLPYLLQLKTNFTMYSLDNVIQMKKKYSIRFYELLKQYQKIGKRTFLISELRELLSCEKEYSKFKDFEKYAIAPAVKEINLCSDIEVDYTKIKSGKAITSIEFSIKKKENSKEISRHFELLTEEEFEKLSKEFTLDEIIEVYDRVRFGASSLKIKNHYAYILTVLREEKNCEKYFETENENEGKKNETKTDKEKNSSRNFEKVFDEFSRRFEM